MIAPPPGGGSTAPDGAIGGPGPAAPPAVDSSGINIAADPTDPQPGGSATLTITVSGRNGADRYGVAGAVVRLLLKEKPGPDAKLDATSLTTDSSGTATATLTLSRTLGRHVVDATSGALTTEYVADTLSGTGQVSRARHSGEFDQVPVAPRPSPAPFFIGAGLIVLFGFAAPYIGRSALSGRPPLPALEPIRRRVLAVRASSRRTS